MPKVKVLLKAKIVADVPEDRIDEMREMLQKFQRKLNRKIAEFGPEVKGLSTIKATRFTNSDIKGGESKKEDKKEECDCPACRMERELKEHFGQDFADSHVIRMKKGQGLESLFDLLKEKFGQPMNVEKNLEALENLVRDMEATKPEELVGENLELKIKRVKSVLDLGMQTAARLQKETPPEGKEEQHGKKLELVNKAGEKLLEIYNRLTAMRKKEDKEEKASE